MDLGDDAVGSDADRLDPALEGRRRNGRIGRADDRQDVPSGDRGRAGDVAAISGLFLGVPPPDGAVLPAREGPLEQVDIAPGSVARLQCLPVLAVDRGPDRAGFQRRPARSDRRARRDAATPHRAGAASMSGRGSMELAMVTGTRSASALSSHPATRVRARRRMGQVPAGRPTGAAAARTPAANAPPTTRIAAAASSVNPRRPPSGRRGVGAVDGDRRDALAQLGRGGLVVADARRGTRPAGGVPALDRSSVGPLGSRPPRSRRAAA